MDPEASPRGVDELAALLAEQGDPQAAQTAHRYRLARETRIALAREDPAVFAELILHDERTGKPIRMPGMHWEWHRLADSAQRTVIWSHVESGKTQQMGIARMIWLLGRDPTRRIAVVSNTYGQAEKVVRSIGQYIEQSEEVHSVFPNLRPAEPWTSGQLFVQRPTRSKDPSVQACGVHGNITGSRLEAILLDDVLDFENTRTRTLRQDLWEWYHATLVGRLTEWGRVVAIGTAYHPDDLMHRFARQGIWTVGRFPVLDERGESSWCERWPLARIEQQRIALGAAEFNRQMLCRARDDCEARFQQEWVDGCLARGDGLPLLLTAPDILPKDSGVFTGVDLAVQTHEAADESCLFTLVAHGNGDRQVAEVKAGRWTGPEIVRRIIDTHERFGSIVYVENNAAQDFLLQFLREHSDVPVRPFTTGRNKAHPEFGIEGLAVEFQNARWIIPNEAGRCDPEVETWLAELLYYNPRDHTGDRLMASWFAREGARRFQGQRKGSVGLRVVG